MRFYILPIRVCLILSCLAILPVHALGQGQEQGLDPDRFLEFLEQKPRAERGVNEFILGRSYLLGLFHEQDQEKGLDLLQRAAQSGYIPAMLLLAEAFEKGLAGIERDYVQAQKWYSQAAEQGSEPARIRMENLEPADPEQDFSLFGIDLNQADRFALRFALQKKGAEPLRLEDSSKCDVFASQGLLPGSDQLQACFTADGKLAHVDYRFPPRPPGEQEVLYTILEDLRDKYGQAQQVTQEDGVPMLYRWQKKGVNIKFWQEGMSQTAFLRYSLPENQARLNRELRAEEQEPKEPRIDPENY
ncbi:MAG: tetratricopeptide repeat protein [Thermodesulfobacteriota bacterium]